MLLAACVVGGLGRAQVGVQRRLGIDHDQLAARQFHQQVGAQFAAVAVVAGLLLGEVAVLDHAGHFDHPRQLDLAPAPARGRRAQRGDQAGGFAVQLRQVGFDQTLQLLVERGVRGHPRLFQLAQFAVDLAQRLLQRLDQRLDGFLARRKVGLGAFLIALQLGAGQRQKRFVVLLQRLRRQVAEGVGE